ncbi:MAG: type IV pilin protein [Pseudomonadota bacterium]
MTQQSRNRGFTLIEVMIVVVIIGVLVSIAYPSYQRHMIQTRRSDAQAALLQIANQQERFFTECNYYATTLTGNRACGASAGNGVLNYAAATSPDGHYALTLVQGVLLADGTTSASCSTWACGFSAVANPNSGASGRQAGDGRFMINSLGQKFWDRNNDGDYADTSESKWTK